MPYYPPLVSAASHPSAAKAWVSFDGTGTVTILASYNVDSITDNGTADYTINIGTDFSSADYCAVITGDSTVGSNNNPVGANITTEAAGSMRILMANSVANPDCDRVYAVFFGDQ